MDSTWKQQQTVSHNVHKESLAHFWEDLREQCDDIMHVHTRPAPPAPPARQKTTHASIESGQQTNPMQCPNTYVEQIQITLHLEHDQCDHQTQYHDNMMSI